MLPNACNMGTSLCSMSIHVEATTEGLALEAKRPIGEQTRYHLACICALSSAAARKDINLSELQRDQLAEHYATQALALLTKAHAAGYFQIPATAHKLKT